MEPITHDEALVKMHIASTANAIKKMADGAYLLIHGHRIGMGEDHRIGYVFSSTAKGQSTEFIVGDLTFRELYDLIADTVILPNCRGGKYE